MTKYVYHKAGKSENSLPSGKSWWMVNHVDSDGNAVDLDALGGGAAAWGSITGTLSAQTDLQGELDGKSATSHNHDAAYSALGHNHDADYAGLAAYTTHAGDTDIHFPASDAGGWAPTICVLGKTANQNVGGSNGTEVWWTWETETRVDAGYTFSSDVPSRVAVDAGGWYRIRFLGNAQQTGSARTTLQGIYRVNGGSTLRTGSVRDYTRGSGYGNLSPGLECIIQLSASDYIEVGTRVEDTDSVYTLNTTGGEIATEENQLTLEKL